MAFFESVMAIAAFLSVSAAAVFVILVIGIRKGDRTRHLSDGPDSALDAIARKFLGVGVRGNPHDEN